MSDEIFVHDAELAVLSIILKSPEFSHRVENLRPFMFSSTTHSRLFSEIESFNERDLVPEPSLIVSHLKSINALNSVGGDDFIKYLIEQEYEDTNFSEYKNLVIDAYRSRKLVGFCSTVSADSVNPSNVADYIENLKRNIEGLNSNSGGDTTKHVGADIKGVYDNIIERVNNPGVRGFTWGIPSIDYATGGKSAGDLWVIGGRPSSGKSAVVCNSMLTDAKNGTPSLLISKEMNFQSLVERFLAIDTGISLQKIRMGLLEQRELDAVYAKLKEFKDYPIYIDSNFSSTLPYIESTIRKYHSSKGVEIVYLDYLQLVTDRGPNQTNELGQITRTFKLLSNSLNIASVVVSQLSRGVEMREDKRPMLSDLRQSGNIEEDADLVVGIYRDDYYNKNSKDKGMMEFIILKHRNGPTGTLPLKFIPETNILMEAK